jgi:ParB/RepB/Spo0J family partition protein
VAMKFNFDVKRSGEIFLIDPKDIPLVLEDNSRQEAHPEGYIHWLANNMLEEGQQQPILLRKFKDGNVSMVAGYARRIAGQYINEVLRPKDQPFLLKAIVEALSDIDAYKKSVIENLRNEVKPIDHAHSQKKFRESFGWTDEQIAKLYNQTVSYVNQLKQLLVLPHKVQEEMKKGELPLQAATALASVPEKEAVVIMEAARRETDGKVDTGEVVRRVRTARVEAGEKARALSQKETKELLVHLQSVFSVERPKLSDIIHLISQCVSGKILEEDLYEKICALVPAMED